MSRCLCIVTIPLLIASTVAAQPAKDPLRFVPSQTELVIKVERPRDLIETVEKHDLFQQAQKLTGVRELYDTTNFRQLYQLIAYFEKQLGKDRNDILDDISYGGVVLAARLTPPTGALLIVQAKDETRLRRFVDLGLEIVGKELERQESKDKIVREKSGRFDIGRIGPKLHFAIADGALLVSPEEPTLKQALDTQRKKGGAKNIVTLPNFIDARKKAAPKAMGWLWLHLEELRKNNEFKSGLDTVGLDPAQMVLFGGIGDIVRRASYLTATLTPDGADGYRIAVQMPSGRDGMAPLKHMMLSANDDSTLPLLLPPRVIASTSYFLDLGQFWDKRVEILGEQNAKGLDEGNKNLAKFLGGIKLSKLFHAAGPHHRLVFAQQKESPYKIKPAAPFPAFALVVDMRDPSFGKDMNSILRSAALLLTFQVGLNLKEEKYKDCDLVSYYFTETKKVEGDVTNVRFNFSPTYVTVGNNFVMSATAELARDLIDVLQMEKNPQANKASMKTKVFASGFADIARANQDAALTQLILAQALPPQTAKEELRRILDLTERLGSLGLEINYGTNDFRYDILWRPHKSKTK
jgi:hypothetical protein